jgi:hypothetical protein
MIINFKLCTVWSTLFCSVHLLGQVLDHLTSSQGEGKSNTIGHFEREPHSHNFIYNYNYTAVAVSDHEVLW